MSKLLHLGPDQLTTYECLRENPPALYKWLKEGAVMRPNVLGLKARWDSAAANQAPKKLSFDEQVTDDLFVQAVVYDVERPEFAVGSLDKPFSDQQNALRPGINLRLQVEGGFGTEQFSVNIQGRPIQLLLSQCQQEGPLKQVFSRGFVLTFNQQINAEAYLTRALSDGETPYNLTISIHGLRLGCRAFQGLSSREAVELLRKEYQIGPELEILRPLAPLPPPPPWSTFAPSVSTLPAGPTRP